MALTIEQKRTRQSGIGGSDCAAILGLSSWSTPLQVYFSKFEEDITEDENNQYTEWGNRLEPVIIEAFQDKTGLEVVDMHKAFGLKKHEVIRHSKYPWMFANLDGYIPSENAVLEAKTANSFMVKKWGWDDSDTMPDYYLTQCAHYRIVVEDFLKKPVEKVYLAVLIGGNDYRILSYKKNPRLEAIIIEKERVFWNEHVLKKIPPSEQNLDDFYLQYSQSDPDSVVQADEDLEGVVYAFDKCKQEIKRIESIMNELKLKICDRLKDKEVLLSCAGEQLLSWKTGRQTRLDMHKLKKEEPEIYSKYIKESSNRILRIKNLYDTR